MKIEKQKLRTFSYAEEGLLSAEDVGEGRVIPVIVLDVEENQDIIDLIKVHYSITSGDVTMSWVKDFFNRKVIIFKMSFVKPMHIEFGIRFNVNRDFMLIDGIMQSKGLYLQTGKKGDKISRKLGDKKILMEVPDLGIKDIWDKMLLKTIIDKYRKKGYSRKEAKKIALQHIISIREMWKFRRD